MAVIQLQCLLYLRVAVGNVGNRKQGSEAHDTRTVGRGQHETKELSIQRGETGVDLRLQVTLSRAH